MGERRRPEEKLKTENSEKNTKTDHLNDGVNCQWGAVCGATRKQGPTGMRAIVLSESRVQCRHCLRHATVFHLRLHDQGGPFRLYFSREPQLQHNGQTESSARLSIRWRGRGFGQTE